MASGAFAKAARQYTKALELDPANAVLFSNRSAAHFNLRQFTESLEDAESAILCDSMWWKAYKRKGLSLIHMQRYEEAIEALEEGLKIVKKNAEMEKNLEFARACQEQAQNLYILPEPHMMQRLESVPVFIVTDDVGQPFFITYEDGQQVCTFYFDKADANSTLDWIKSENPDLGDTARVIHITLNQAFNLAQETQKQYYEETTRAAVEEDRRAAMGEQPVTLAKDIDGSDEEKDDSGKSEEEVKKEEKVEPPPSPPTQSEKNAETKEGEETKKSDEKADDDSLIDDNAPLSFQFRPELRQVQIAVELLNKNPNPPVRPILRDPPSVRKAKAEAAAEAAAAAAAAEAGVVTEAKPRTSSCCSPKGCSAAPAEVAETDQPKTEDGDKSGDVKMVKVEDSKSLVSYSKAGDVTMAKADEAKASDVKMEDVGEEAKEKIEKAAEEAKAKVLNEEDDEELTVDNFNGIPIFQAKGLTLLQNNEQLIPLFFSKWDLEQAWKQLMTANSTDVPKECEVDVGTLEDVLRRMSESKTKEFESVFFVPSRESMKAIGAKFPLDDLAATRPVMKPTVRKATFSKAKQIAARGGTKEEIRAAIKEDLELAKERQRMAEIIAQIEQARRLGGGASAASGMRRSGRIDRTMRRNAQRLAQKQAARMASRNAAAIMERNKAAAAATTSADDSNDSTANGEEKNEAKAEESTEPDSNVQVTSATSAAAVRPEAPITVD